MQKVGSERWKRWFSSLGFGLRSFWFVKTSRYLVFPARISAIRLCIKPSRFSGSKVYNTSANLSARSKNSAFVLALVVRLAEFCWLRFAFWRQFALQYFFVVHWDWIVVPQTQQKRTLEAPSFTSFRCTCLFKHYLLLRKQKMPKAQQFYELQPPALKCLEVWVERTLNPDPANVPHFCIRIMKAKENTELPCILLSF